MIMKVESRLKAIGTRRLRPSLFDICLLHESEVEGRSWNWLPIILFHMYMCNMVNFGTVNAGSRNGIIDVILVAIIRFDMDQWQCGFAVFYSDFVRYAIRWHHTSSWMTTIFLLECPRRMGMDYRTELPLILMESDMSSFGSEGKNDFRWWIFLELVEVDICSVDSDTMTV